MNLYLDLLKRCLLDSIYGNDEAGADPQNPDLDHLVRFRGAPGGKWASHAHTMIGEQRLENVRQCMENVLANDIPGDLIETGVWRGGATIFMRGILKAHGVTDRCVWVADSFAGLPVPDPERFPADANDMHHTFRKLAVNLATVKENFARYDLLDEQVRFLQGFFKDSLPTIPSSQRFAVIRLDGDMYESTWQALANLYPKLSPGGFCIIDDFALLPCRKAVEDYRQQHMITEPIQIIDWTGVYWQKLASPE